MSFRFLNYGSIFALLCLSVFAVAEESERRSFSLQDFGSIQLQVPKSWQSHVSAEARSTIEFRPKGAPMFKVLLTPLRAQKSAKDTLGSVEIKKFVEQMAEKIRSQAVETEIPIKELTGPSAVGYYFTCTDKAPKPGEYKYLSQGIFRLDDLFVSFTVLTNDDSKAINDETITILANAEYSDGGSPSSADGENVSRGESIQVTQGEGDYLITIPVSRIMMRMPSGTFLRKNPSGRGGTDHPRYFYLEDTVSHCIISGWFEAEQQFIGVEKLWQDQTSAWEKDNLPEPRDVLFKKIGKWDAIVYDTKVPVYTNSHIRAHWIQAGTWIDIHLSITSKETSENARSQLESLLKTLVVTEKQ